MNIWMDKVTRITSSKWRIELINVPEKKSSFPTRIFAIISRIVMIVQMKCQKYVKVNISTFMGYWG